LGAGLAHAARRASALADCQRQKDGWSQYYGLPIRIVEELGFRNHAVVG
jgi:hypothetical protein